MFHHCVRRRVLATDGSVAVDWVENHVLGGFSAAKAATERFI